MWLDSVMDGWMVLLERWRSVRRQGRRDEEKMRGNDVHTALKKGHAGGPGRCLS